MSDLLSVDPEALKAQLPQVEATSVQAVPAVD